MTTVLDKFSSSKNAIVEVNQETKDFIKYIESLDSIGDRNVKSIANSFGDVSESVVDAAQDLKTGKIGLDEFKTASISASTATSVFGATLKTVAANIAIMIAVTAGIKLIAFTYDQIAHRQENLNEKAAESAKVYEELQDEIDSLNEKHPIKFISI